MEVDLDSTSRQCTTAQDGSGDEDDLRPEDANDKFGASELRGHSNRGHVYDDQTQVQRILRGGLGEAPPAASDAAARLEDPACLSKY